LRSAGSYAAIKLPKNGVGAKQIKAERSALARSVGEKYWARISGGTSPTVLSSSGNVTVARAANLAAGHQSAHRPHRLGLDLVVERHDRDHRDAGVRHRRVLLSALPT
jgi:hypothetical protein